MPDYSNTADIVERLESLIFMRDEDQTDHNAFISGFAYGRFSTLDSEMALHWFMRGADTPATCSIVGEPKSLLAPDPKAAAEIKALRADNAELMRVAKEQTEVIAELEDEIAALKDHRKVGDV